MKLEIEKLRRKRDYYPTAPSWVHRIFITEGSLDWFIKDHREALMDEGAILKIGRDYFIHEDRFPTVAARLRGIPEAWTNEGLAA